MRSGEVAAAMWDTGGWTLNRENRRFTTSCRARARSAGSTRSRCRRGRNEPPPTRGSTSPCGRRTPPASSSGRQLDRRAGHRAVRRPASGAVHASFSRRRIKKSTGIRRFRRDSKRSRVACSTASRRPIEHGGSRRRRVVKRFADHSAVDRCRSRSSAAVFLHPRTIGLRQDHAVRMIAGFIAPDSGDISIGGRACGSRPTGGRSTWCSSNSPSSR